MKTVQQKPVTRPLTRTLSWGMWRLSARILGPECGWPTGRSFHPCLAPLWPLTVAGAACWEQARWCWHRHLSFTFWAEVSVVIYLSLFFLFLFFFYTQSLGFSGFILRLSLHLWNQLEGKVTFVKQCFTYMHMKPFPRGQSQILLCSTNQQCSKPTVVKVREMGLWSPSWIFNQVGKFWLLKNKHLSILIYLHSRCQGNLQMFVQWHYITRQQLKMYNNNNEECDMFQL